MHALLRHELECRLVDEVAVLDTTDAASDGVAGALGREAVCRDQRAALQSAKP